MPRSRQRVRSPGTASPAAGRSSALERDEMRLVAARDGPHFSHARMHLSGLLDLAFSDSVRPHFYFAWGCFRNFGSRSAMYRARDTRLSMLGAAAKRFNFKPSCSRSRTVGQPWRGDRNAPITTAGISMRPHHNSGAVAKKSRVQGYFRRSATGIALDMVHSSTTPGLPASVSTIR